MSLPNIPAISAAHQKVLDYIESTFHKVITDIQDDSRRKGAVVLRRITAIRPYHDDADYMRLKWQIEDVEVVYTFPGKGKDDAWRFGRLSRRVCGCTDLQQHA